MRDPAANERRFRITRHQVALSVSLAVATLALICAVPIAIGWAYDRDPRWMPVGLVFFSGTILGYGFSAVGVLSGQEVRAGLLGASTGISLAVIALLLLGS
ncbi:MAG TPA: hypothetical protein VGN12_16310 [Pirellulales bacterium]|jgi:hypothetical protein